MGEAIFRQAELLRGLMDLRKAGEGTGLAGYCSMPMSAVHYPKELKHGAPAGSASPSCLPTPGESLNHVVPAGASLREGVAHGKQRSAEHTPHTAHHHHQRLLATAAAAISHVRVSH